MNKNIISDYYLERYVLGELPEDQEREIRQKISENPSLRTALEELKASNTSFLSLYPPAKVNAILLSRIEEDSGSTNGEDWLERRPIFTRKFLAISSATAAALVLIIFLVIPSSHQKTVDELNLFGPDFSLVKGIQNLDLTKTQILVFRKNETDVEVLANGSFARKGDLLQLAYIASGKSFGMILSIDGRGTITLHFPEKIEGSTELIVNKKSLLPNAIELDDAPNFERFIFITSNNKIDVENVLKSTEDLVKYPNQMKECELKLPEGMEQHSVLILKGEGS